MQVNDNSLLKTFFQRLLYTIIMQVNDNSLLKTFFQRLLYTIIMPSYYCYDVTFCIWSLYFVYRKNKLTNQTNKTVTRWLKIFQNTVKKYFLSN